MLIRVLKVKYSTMLRRLPLGKTKSIQVLENILDAGDLRF